MYGDDEISLQCLTAFDDAGTSFRVGVIDVPGKQFLPAPDSTITSTPARFNFLRLVGTRATRRSFSGSTRHTDAHDDSRITCRRGGSSMVP